MALSGIPRSACLWLLLTLGAPLASASGVDVQRFVEQAAEAGVASIEAAELALRSSDSADIKDFAQRIIDDHPRSSADLQAFARERRVRLPTDRELQDRARPELKSLTGKDFDARFADLQAKRYERSVALFSQAAERGDADLQAFARAKLPVLKYQLQTARMLTRAHPS